MIQLHTHPTGYVIRQVSTHGLHLAAGSELLGIIVVH